VQPGEHARQAQRGKGWKLVKVHVDVSPIFFSRIGTAEGSHLDPRTKPGAQEGGGIRADPGLGQVDKEERSFIRDTLHIKSALWSCEQSVLGGNGAVMAFIPSSFHCCS
jgi:hypothetical protein